jgi:Tfp pilus assembly protein PilO
MRGPLARTVILGVLALFILAAASWFLLLNPRIEEPASLQAAADSAVAQGQSLVNQAADLQQYEANVGKAAVASVSLGERFPSSPDVPYLNEQVNSAAARAGMTVDQVQSIVPAKPVIVSDVAAAPASGAPAPEASAPGTTLETARMDVTITAVGSFQEVTDFLNELQAAKRVIIIDTTRIVQQAMPAPPAVTNPDGSVTQPPAPVGTEYQLTVTAHVIIIPALKNYADEGTNVFSATGTVPAPAASATPTASAQPVVPAASATPTASAQPVVPAASATPTASVPAAAASPSTTAPATPSTTVTPAPAVAASPSATP